MKITIILLLVILAMAACASPLPASPIIQPLPNPIQTAVPVPVQPVSTVASSDGSTGIPSPLPGPLAGSTRLAVPTAGITMAEDGQTFSMHPGESFLLNLGTDTFNWSVNIDDQNVLAMVKGVMVIRGAQGIYQAGNPGQAVLTAVGTPLCQNTGQVCNALAILFKVTVIVH